MTQTTSDQEAGTPSPPPPDAAPPALDLAQPLDAARSEPEAPIRLQGLFRAVEVVLLKVEALSRRVLPDAWNPLLHSGAWANTSLLIATASGILLLFWYQSSVHQAHASMRAIEASFIASLVRALHRYSSDLCVLLVGWHTLRLTAARRFTGARWLAWVTGFLSIALLWSVGWTGYWLVWDTTAQQVALSSVRALDVLPIFADPLSKAFLADATVNSLFFFIIFFFHMLVPMALGVALWLHIARLQRPVFITTRNVTIALGLALLAVSGALLPEAGDLARMAKIPGAMNLDAWFLLPLVAMERLSGGAMVALFLSLGVVGFSVPWLLRTKPTKPATIIEARCNACDHCVTDCPYEAIEMVPRTDGRPFKSTAKVIPDRCVGCGICAGSCASGGSGLPHFDMLLERARLEKWAEAGDGRPVAFVCHDAAPSGLKVDDATGDCAQLPGYRVRLIPCAGWVQAITVDRLLRKGAQGVLIAGCAGSCRFREGMAFTQERLDAKREPELPRHADRAKVRLIDVDRTQPHRLSAEAEAFRSGRAASSLSRLPPWVGAAVTTVVLAGVIFAFSRVPYTPPQPPAPLLAVAFKHPGKVEEACHVLTEEEKLKLPPHMRVDKQCQRRRPPVRIEVLVDGARVLAKSYEPEGLWGDGASIGLEEVTVTEGRHRVEMRVGDTVDASAWAFTDAREVDFKLGERPALVFDRVNGFAWYLADGKAD